MAKFCTKCGRPLTEGEVCNCATVNGNPAPGTSNPNTVKANSDSVSINVTEVASTVSGFWISLKNRIGIGDPMINEGDAFEKSKRIVPDCVKPNDSEIPVRQYNIATLRNRILGITYTKAYGRMQVTNKRVIFRAPGRCLAGRTTLQHEFAIDEIAGIETRREFVFNFWDMLLGLIVFAIGGGISTLLSFLITDQGSSVAGAFIMSLIFAAIAGVVFFMVKKKWLLKLFCLGAGVTPAAAFGGTYAFTWFYDAEFIGYLLLFFAFVLWVISLITMFIYAIRPNLALIVKTKSASEAIDIRRKKVGFLGLNAAQNEKFDHTGYTEIWPEEDAEKSIREIGAMINDIQKLGDFGIEKWKQ